MQNGKLKYFPDSNGWKLVNKQEQFFEPNPANVSIMIKIFNQFIYCFICKVVDGSGKNSDWYIRFYNTKFVLDRTQSYEVRFTFDKPECTF